MRKMKSWKDELHYKKRMKKMGLKPRRRKDSHQWWESPWIDYDTPLQCYYIDNSRSTRWIPYEWL